MKNTKEQIILLIEDNPGDIRLMKEMIKGITSSEYRLICSESLKEGCEKIKNNELILILLDLNLPDSTGKQTFDTIMKCAESIPIVLVSGMQDEELSLSLIKEGAQDYIVKNDLNSGLLGKTIQYALIRKQAEEAEKASYNLLFNLSELVPGVIYQYRLYPDGSSCFPYSSSGMNDIYEYSPKDVREDATPVFGRIYPDDVEHVSKLIFESARSLELFICEFRVVLPRQGLRWRYSTAVPQRMEDGGTQWHGIISDITERKQAEEMLIKSEQEFHSLAESMPQIVWITRPDGWNIYFNQQWVDYTGLTLEESYGHGWNKPFHPEDQQSAWEAWQNAVNNNGIYSIEVRLRRFDGEYRWWLIRGIPVINEHGEILKWFGTCTDIEDMKQSHEDLIASETLYRSLFENMLNGFAYCQMLYENGRPSDFIYLNVNKSFELLTGLKNVTGKKVSDVIPGFCETDKPLLELYSRVALTGKSETFEMFIKGLNDWYYISVYSPKKEFFVAVFDVITERKQTVEALIRSEKELKKAQEITHIGSWYLNVETNQVVWSEELYKMYGFDPALPPPPYTEHQKLFTPESWETLSSSLANTRETGIPYELELKTVREDGSNGWMWVRGETVQDKEGNTIALWGAAQDITERKREEEKLITSEEKFRNLIETMPEGFYRSTPEGYFAEVNPAFVKMLGYESMEELMKIYIPEELYFLKDERDNRGGDNTIFTSDSEIYRLKKKDGSEIWVDDYSRYIKDESGEIIYHEGIMRDITESLNARKAIIEAKNKAEEMSRLKSSFLANMSHEIRTPLNGILGFAQLLQEDVKDDEQLKFVKVIEKSGNRLLETLDLILNFSKLEAETVSAKYREVNVSDVIDEVVDSFEAMAKIKKLVIEKKIKQKNLVTKIDERFLRHVLNNLVKNAIVYTKKGGITVTFDTDEKDMILKVKDTGIGITKENFDLIFEPFRQESEGYGRNFEGTGLGLSITKRFVELMRGKIEVESEAGAGSTFMVRLPFTDADAATKAKTGKKETSKKAPVEKIQEKKELSILLVENDEANRYFTLAVLNKYYKTEFAVDGQEAIDAAKKKNYDIILMDINLGKDIDGIMATKEIRKMKGYKDTPIVAMTAYVREGDKEEFLAGGCTHYLGKPFTVKQLLDLVEEIRQ